MMNQKDHCSLFDGQLRLTRRSPAAGDLVSRGTQTNHGFIRDLQQLETVLGTSQTDWFERLTEQRLDWKLSSRPLPGQLGAGGFDSPSPTPTISQLISVASLRVGSSPAFSYDSPVRFSSSYRQSPVRTPDNWNDWQKPLLGTSPSPGQSILARRGAPHPSSATVQSLGVLADDSALSWTDSLATPPRNDISDLSAELTTPEGKQKETARALFPSTSDRLNTTGDSVQPLDSTYEDDPSTGHQSDLSMEEAPAPAAAAAAVTPGDGNRGDNTLAETSDGDGAIISLVARCSPTKSGTTPGNQGDNKRGTTPNNKGDNLISPHHKPVSFESTDGKWTVQNVSGFGEISSEMDQDQASGDIHDRYQASGDKHDHDQASSDHTDLSFSLGRKSGESQAKVQDSIKLAKHCRDEQDLSRNTGSKTTTAASLKSTEKLQQDNRTGKRQIATNTIAQNAEKENSLENIEVSPTFTQKVSRKCFKGKKSGQKKKRARWQEVCMDEVLSDFFDSPATATRKRRSSTGTGVGLAADVASGSGTRQRRESAESGNKSQCDETDAAENRKKTEGAVEVIDIISKSASTETDSAVNTQRKEDAMPGIGIIAKSSSIAGNFGYDANTNSNSPIPKRIHASEIKCSTPKDKSAPVMLQSILSSSQKKKGSSGKKVRFSENVKKYTISSNYRSVFKKKQKPASVAEPDAKKVKFEEDVVANVEVNEEGDSGIGSSGDHANSFSKVEEIDVGETGDSNKGTHVSKLTDNATASSKVEEVDMDETRDPNKGRDVSKLTDHTTDFSKVGEIDMDETGDLKKGRDISKCSESIDHAAGRGKVGVNMDETGDSNISTVPMKVLHTRHEQYSEASAASVSSKGQVKEVELSNAVEKEIKMVDTFGDDFSQISPSSLNEMCSVADQSGSYMSNDVDKKSCGLLNNESPTKKTMSSNNKRALQQSTEQMANVSATRPAPKLKFLYPSTRHIAASFPKKVFQYEENSQSAKQEGLVQPVLARNIVSNEDSVYDNDDISKAAQDEKIPNRMPETEIFESSSVLDEDLPRKPLSGSVTEVADLADQNRREMASSTSEEVKNTVSSDLRKDTDPASPGLVKGFQSASGKSLQLSADSLENASRLLNEDCDTNTKPAAKEDRNRNRASPKATSKGFQSASGKSLQLSAESLEKASRLLNEVDSDASTKPTSRQGGHGSRDSPKAASKGFQSASRKSLNLSAASLEKASRLLNEEDSDISTKPAMRQGRDRNRESPNAASKGFQSASGKSLNLSAASLEKASRLLNEVDGDIHTTPASRQVQDRNSASPKSTSISTHEEEEECMQIDEKEVDFSGEWPSDFEPETLEPDFSTDPADIEPQDRDLLVDQNFKEQGMNVEIKDNQGASSYTEEHKANMRQPATEVGAPSGNGIPYKTGFAGFQTASGRKLECSEEALKKAECCMSETSNRDTETSNLPNVSKPHLEHEMPIKLKPQVNGEQKQLNISVRKSDDNDEMFVKRSDTKRTTDVMGAGTGFSTAGGNKPHLSDANIRKARSVLSDFMGDADDHTHDKTVYNNEMSVKSSDIERPVDVMGTCTGFSTAGGKQLQLSDANIRKARSVLSDFMGETEKETQVTTGVAENGINKGQQVEKLTVAERLKLEFQEDNLNEASEICSITEELQKLKSKRTNDDKKETSTEAAHLPVIKPSTAKSTLHKSNLPQGFRPFKAPKPSGSKSPGKNKYPESKLSDWNLADTSSNSTTSDKTSKVNQKIERNPQVFKVPEEADVEEIRKSESFTVKSNSTTCTETNKADMSCSELYEGLSQVFSEELDASFEEAHATNGDKKNKLQSVVPSDSMALTTDKETTPQISMGFSTASGKPFKLSETSVKSAQKLLAESEEPLLFRLKDHEDSMKTTSEHSVAKLLSDSKCSTTTVPEIVKAKNVGLPLSNSRELNRPMVDELRRVDCDVPPPCYKASLNTSIASIENDSVGRHEQMDEKSENELPISHDLADSLQSTSCNSAEMSASKLELGGFQTASGKHVNISENAVVNAQQKFDIENGDSLESLKPIGISKAARLCRDQSDHLDDIEDGIHQPCDKEVDQTGDMEVRVDEQKLDTISKNLICDTKKTAEFLCGFQTASGKSLHISDESVEKAKQALIVDTDENIPSCNYDVAGGSDKVTKVESGSLVPASTSENDHGKSLNMFQTASRKAVQVSDQAILAAKRKLDVDTADKCGVSTDKSLSRQLLIDCPKKLRFTEKPDVGEVKTSNKVINKNTAQSSLSESSISHSEDDYQVQDLNMNTMSNEKCFFQTASGKKMNVSEESLLAAKKNIVDNDNVGGVLSDVHALDAERDSKSAGIKVGLGNAFQTAAGSQVKVSEKALAVARKTFEDNDDIMKQKVDIGNPFQTASGGQVKVSEKALAFARKTLDENNCTNTNTSTNPFKTASGGHVNISEKALALARKTLDDNGDSEIKSYSTCTNPFKTAAGGQVKVSEKALAFARTTLQDSERLNENPLKKTENTFEAAGSCNPSQTASGSVVKVSEKALLFARKSLNDAIIEMDTTEKLTDKPEDTLRKDKDEMQNVRPANNFQTASGSKVKVSEKALAVARKTLDEPNCGAQQIDPVCPFQSASGKTVKVSDKALAFARSIAEKDKLCAEKGGQNTAEFLPENNTNIKHGMSKTRTDVGAAHASDSTEVGRGFDDELLKLRSERDKALRNRLNNNNQNETGAKTADGDLQNSEALVTNGPPGKRQRLEDGMEKAFDAIFDRGPLKRKPVRTRPEGITTDRRHPGFRPFKPVRCKMQDSPAARLDTILQTTGPKKDVSSGSKPSFHTPYRSSAAAPPTPVTTDKVKVTMPIFRNSLTKGEATHVTQASNGIGNENKSVNQSIFVDKLSSNLNRCDSENDNLDTENPVNATSKDYSNTAQAEANSKNNELVVSKRYAEGQSFSGEVKAEQLSTSGDAGGGKTGALDVEMDDGENHREGDRKADTSGKAVANNDDDVDSDLASYSQDEEDLFYCHLVEARRQQGEINQEKTGKRAVRVKPLTGRLYEMKQTQGRWRLRDLVNTNAMAQPCMGASVCAASAAGYSFRLDDHYTRHTARVLVGDGALLVPDDSGMAGRQEFYSAFLTLSGVDPKLISEAWLFNHYRWIVWKLAAYEACIPYMTGRCLTPEMVMLQLKYRYDREIDLAQRSSIRKIFEKDDTSSKRMVLCVAGIQHVHADSSSAGAGDHVGPANTRSLDSKVLLELTDGWYSIKAAADVPMTDLAHRGKVWVGQKMCISGAEVIGGEDACSPLEAPEGVMLKLCCNSARTCPWDTPLGYQPDPRPLCVPLSSLYGEGGNVGVVDVVVVRKYPVMYMEKFAGGGSMFRTGRCEEKARQEFERRTETAMQKLYREVEEQADKENQQGLKRSVRGCKKWSRTEVEGLGTGEEIYDGLNSANQPDSFQNYLSDRQLELLYEHQRTVQEQKQVELNSRVQEAWRDRQETAPDRNVTPVLKLRVCGCSRKDMDSGTSTILTVWRPAPEILELQEGKRYKIYSLNTSTSRSKYTGHTVQLTATKQTKFQLMMLDENFLDNIYEPREVLWVSDVMRRRPAYGELDFVGQVVRANPASAADSGKPCDTVYLADCQGNILAVKVWNGFKSFGEDLFVTGGVLCCSNLMDKSQYRVHHLPTVEAATEFTLFSKRPQTPGHRRAVERLNSAVQENDRLLETSQNKLEDLLSGKPNYTEPNRMMQTPSSRLNSSSCPRPEQTIPSPVQEIPAISDTTPCKTPTKTSPTSDQGCHNEDNQSSNSNMADLSHMTTPQSDVAKAKKSVYQSKMARLLSYSSPGVISPMNTPVTRGVRKGFKPPAFKKTGEDSKA